MPKTRHIGHDMVTDWVSTETIRENQGPQKIRRKEKKTKKNKNTPTRKERKKKKKRGRHCNVLEEKEKKKKKKTRNKNKLATKKKTEEKNVSRSLVQNTSLCQLIFWFVKKDLN